MGQRSWLAACITISGVGEKSSKSVQTIEPPASLIDCLGDKFCGEVLQKDLLVLERIVPLRIRHSARIEPYIDRKRHATIGLAVLFKTDLIDKWTVQIQIFQAASCKFLQFRNTADAEFLFIILTDPDRQRR